MIKIDDALQGVTHLGLDTAPIIYFVEAHPRYEEVVVKVFQSIADGQLAGITSMISLVEVLVQPIARADTSLEQEYRNILLNSNNFITMSINLSISEEAARLRARYRLRTPDALQMAVALDAGCQAFLTNDIALKRVTELQVLVLDELTV